MPSNERNCINQMYNKRYKFSKTKIQRHIGTNKLAFHVNDANIKQHIRNGMHCASMFGETVY